jgi:hypothetical protein
LRSAGADSFTEPTILQSHVLTHVCARPSENMGA